jgi:hypothetical protein
MIRRGLLPSGLPLSDPLGVSHSVGNLTQLPLLLEEDGAGAPYDWWNRW